MRASLHGEIQNPVFKKKTKTKKVHKKRKGRRVVGSDTRETPTTNPCKKEALKSIMQNFS